MDADLLSSLQGESPDDNDDMKYLRELSTILVATIQEVKDRVSQVESIFCSQLFPSLQLKTKGLQRKLAAVEKTAENELKKKENLLLQQIKDLLHEKERAAEQIQRLSSDLEESKMELVIMKESVQDLECGKKLLQDKVESFVRDDDLIGKLKEQLEQKTFEADGLRRQLREEVELKDQILSTEKAKRGEITEDYEKLKTTYKQLKSQYLHLYRKFSLENEHYVDTMKQDKDSPRFHGSKRCIEGTEEKDKETGTLASVPNVSKIGNFPEKEANADIELVKRSSPDFRFDVASASNPFQSKHIADNTKSKPATILRKTRPSWIETRACQGPRGPKDGDPHDDFLDTPLEMVRNSKKGPSDEAQDIEVPPQDVDFGNSDDETQDLNTKSTLQQQISIPDPANKAFKYVEPVRKKAERENLKGVQCQQCKKFYDAVLPDGKRKSNDFTDMHCEHHAGVSRHRYRYAPPMTPDGFWNIGFDSEI